MQSLSLNGVWCVHQVAGQEEFTAQVPGTIHQDLLAAGRIQDPYYRDNEVTVQWVGETAWVYQRSFVVSAEIMAYEMVLLRCEGLDTLATVRINGTAVAETDNMFRCWEFDVQPLLVLGDNTIEIQFDPAPAYIAERQQERALPGWAGPREISGRGWLRKEPCNFGWDWGPVLITCGIWRSISLLAIDTVRLSDLFIQQDHRIPGTVTLKMTASLAEMHAEPLQALFHVEFKGAIIATVSAEFTNGQAIATCTINDPQLWWPNGMGAQPLYTVFYSLQSSGTELATQSRRIGLRTLRLQRKQDSWGESFQFAANGIPFFAKGANWIPADSFAPRVTREQYSSLIQSAAEANMNMLRSWGGGIYEDDSFYELCDELGICVWQDFIFACTTYPAFDEEFLKNVAAEAEDNVRRLRHHPCIALWCGNNELEMGLVGEAWNDNQMSWEDYGKLFDSLLPSIIARLDPERDYWPSSPHSPHDPRQAHSDPCWGDAHLWDVWHGKKPFEWYRTTEHRFVSEFGFQSFPEPKSAATFTLPEDRNVTSYIMEHHQRSGIGNSTILNYMLEWFQLPNSFPMTLWLSQILQGIGIQYAVEHWRRNMPRTMGALYWQLNDCWPVASWASIDYFGRWKALHYQAKRFFAPLLISCVDDPVAQTVAIHVSSDLLQAQSAILLWQVTDTMGTVLSEHRQAVEIANQQSNLLTIADMRSLAQEHGQRNLLLWAELQVEGVCVSASFASLVRPKHLTLRNPQLSMQVEQEDTTHFLISVSAKRPALWAWLTTEHHETHFADNFVHVRPGAPLQIRATVPALTTLQEFTSDLQVFSLFDTYSTKE